MACQMCLDCLHRRICTDFSDKLVFRYGISDCAYPYGSTAVVQMPNSEGTGASHSFVLLYLPTKEHHCLSKYVDEYCVEDLDKNHECGKDDRTSSVLNQDQVEVSTGIHNDKTTFSETISNGQTYLSGLGCKSLTCKYSVRFSCSRIITALAPISQIGISSYPIFEELASNFLCGSLEDHILTSLSLLIEGKATGRDSLNFLSLIGLPSFDNSGFPGCIRHPNLIPVLGMLKSPAHISIFMPKAPYTLNNILHYSPSLLKSDWQIRFFLYQLLSALAHLHGLGVAHGSICPKNIMLNDSSWCWLNHMNPTLGSSSKELSAFCYNEGCNSQGLYADLKLTQPVDWHSSFNQWWKGELSNFEYLLVLNKLAGRRWGDYTFHTVMPWVIDFSVKPNENNEAGWRDLSKSKWRLAKGDEQLDFTYSTSEIPHHVSDECLSELAACSYKARRLPLSILRLAVRSVYEPNEYPSTMQRLYLWTPDECIPDFYCDPNIFYSLHSGMSDLAVPSWAGTAEEFIKLHREALESDWVSCRLHNWIDITFGYKMSGPAAVGAKNVMLMTSATTTARSAGRRQLFTQPHPARRGTVMKPLLVEAAHLQELEEAAVFCEHASHLSPLYTRSKLTDRVRDNPSVSHVESLEKNKLKIPIDLNYLLEHIEVDDDCSVGYQELLLWMKKLSDSSMFSENIADDIFSVGCILAELHLRRPLFDPSTFSVYLESGALPRLMHELPPHAEVLVAACIQKDWRRRPTAKNLLESPYIPTSVRSSYLFVAPLQLLSKEGTRLRYAANFANRGALKAMGEFAAEMCVLHCLPLMLASLSDDEAEWAYILLKEFLKCLNPKAVKALILPAIQKILQATGYSRLKVSLLQGSFVQDLWNRIGKQSYLEKVHPVVLSNLYVAPHRSSSSAASVLLIGSSEELGVPITVHQTILPLIHCFGKGLCSDGIDVVVRIGGLFGESFVVKQILPLLRNVISSCIDVSYANKPEPMQTWSALSLMDCLTTLDGVVGILSKDVIVKELIEGGSCLYIQILMQINTGIPALQVAATSLIAISQLVGPELTAVHVLPQLKGLFEEFAFSQDSSNSSDSPREFPESSKPEVDEGYQIGSRADLVLLLYPSLASIMGIEKLRQSCATWLLLEQFLLRRYNWKWEYTVKSSRGCPERRSFSKISTSEYNPAKLLLNGFGWSVPQGTRVNKNLIPGKTVNENPQNNQVERHTISSPNMENQEPWYWFPSPASSWDRIGFLSRVGGLKDDFPWKIRASVMHSVRAHHGALRSFAVRQDESTFFTAGVGPGFKGTVQKWDLSAVNSLSGYHGHDEVVNDICVLPSTERVASCDGTVHVWNSENGKLISVFAEYSANSGHQGHSSNSTSRISSDQANSVQNINPISSGILTTAFDESLYTSMHHLENADMLVVGTGNGSLRFIDVNQGQKLHLWRSELVESNFPSLVSSICSCGSDNTQAEGGAGSPSWIAAALSSGVCRLLDVRSGNIITSWQAHDGYVTKLAAAEDHLLVSSSLDRTLKIWDLRRSWATEPVVYRGHNDSVSGFSVWGQDVISISRNKIGVSSLSRSADMDEQHRITPQYLYMADKELRNLSTLSSITILPFSRLFLVGTVDGYLKICC